MVAEWLNRTLVQPEVTWHASQVFEVERCVAVLPVAVEPLWHEAQFPVTPEWSKRTPVKLVVLWQSPQAFEDGMCPDGLPVADLPL